MITMKRSIFAIFTVLLLVILIGPAPAMASGTISGSVYCDHNNNGKLDDEDRGLENIHVQIFTLKCGGTALQTIHTNQDGGFTFQGFDPDTYFIRADVPCVCGGRQPTTTTCQKVELGEGEDVVLPPFGYTEFGQ